MKKIVSLIIIFGIGLVAFSALPDVLIGKRSVVMGITATDIIDLAGAAPFLALIFYFIFSALTRDGKKRPTWLNVLMLVSFFIFFEGHGMHYTGNSIHNLMDKEKTLTSPSVYALTYFYDEILGHKFIYMGFFGLLVSGLILQFSCKTELNRDDKSALSVISFLSGIGMAFFALEGQSAIEALILSPALIIAVARHLRSKKERMYDYPLATYAVISSAEMEVVIIAWAVVFRGLYEPSALFGF